MTPHRTILDQRPVPQNCNGLHGLWGCLPSRRMRTIYDKFPPPDWTGCDLAEAILPSDAQNESSCTCYAFATVLEALYRMRDGANAIPAPMQIDALRLYRELNAYFYHDACRDQGAEIDMPVIIAEQQGLLPTNTEIVEVDLIPAAFAAALRTAPVLVGTAVGGSFMHGCSPETGEVVHQTMTDETILGGHAYALIGIQRDEAGRVWLRFSNSWADWGLNGQCTMEWETFLELWRPFGGRPLTLRLDRYWATWRLPKDWLVPR